MNRPLSTHSVTRFLSPRLWLRLNDPAVWNGLDVFWTDRTKINALFRQMPGNQRQTKRTEVDGTFRYVYALRRKRCCRLTHPSLPVEAFTFKILELACADFLRQLATVRAWRGILPPRMKRLLVECCLWESSVAPVSHLKHLTNTTCR